MNWTRKFFKMSSQVEGQVAVADSSPSFDFPEFQLAILEHHMSTVAGMKQYLEYFIQVHHNFSQDYFQRVVFGVWQRTTKGIKYARDKEFFKRLKRIQKLLELSVKEASDIAARATRLQQAVVELNGITLGLTPICYDDRSSSSIDLTFSSTSASSSLGE